MQLGVSSYSFARHMKNTRATYLDICNEAKRIGFAGIEFIDLDLAPQSAASVQALAQDIRRHCDAIGLSVIAYTVSADFLNRGPEEVDRIKAQVDVAALLGAGVLRHDAAWKLPEGTDWRAAIERLAPPIRQVTQYAQGQGIKTCTENHGFVLQDAERVEALIRAVNHPNYGWLVDMGNFLCVDEPALHALPIAAPYAFHTHAKDFLYKPAWEENPGAGWFDSRNGSHLRGTIPGHGVVPIAYCVKVLRQAGYAGWLSLEFEGMEEPIAAIEAGFQYLHKVLQA